MRKQVAIWLEKRTVVNVIIVLILINAVTLGLETNATYMNDYGTLLHSIDVIILLIFTAEITLKLYAYRLHFFKSGWNIFDLLIVGFAWTPATGPLAVLRTLRILRILRLLSVVPQMRRVISAIGKSIPGMLSVVGVLALLFYVSAVLTTMLFGQHTNPDMQEWFGSIGKSAYTLFQIMTLESWSMGIVRPVMAFYPLAWIFFVPFIIVTSFAVLNLFIGIIVDAMQSVQQERRDKSEVQTITPSSVTAEQLNTRVNELTAEIKDLNNLLRKNNAGP